MAYSNYDLESIVTEIEKRVNTLLKKAKVYVEKLPEDEQRATLPIVEEIVENTTLNIRRLRADLRRSRSELEQQRAVQRFTADLELAERSLAPVLLS